MDPPVDRTSNFGRSRARGRSRRPRARVGAFAVRAQLRLPPARAHDAEVQPRVAVPERRHGVHGVLYPLVWHEPRDHDEVGVRVLGEHVVRGCGRKTVQGDDDVLGANAQVTNSVRVTSLTAM